jgi:hypothetical protein
MRQEIMTITPEIAMEFLLRNTVNRKKRGWWVTALAAMIKRGEWVVSHQGIAFDKSGKLLDGQHRLEAIFDAGIPVQMAVSFDVDEEAYKVLDNGIKRTLSDLTGIHVRTAEVCRILARLAYGGNSVTSADQCIEIYNTGAGEVHDNLIEYCGKNIAVYSSAPVRTAAVCMILDGYDSQYIKDLYFNLCNQKFNELPSIAQALIRQITEKRVSANNKADLLARALKVFNPDYAHVNRLQVSDSEVNSGNVYCRNVVRGLLTEKAA